MQEQPFNPTLVQFKRKAWLNLGLRRWTSFQSYLSPIQTPDGCRKPGGPSHFQSYLSPIQTFIRGCIMRDQYRFQSYLSPIQTHSLALRYDGSVAFQSYLSPIQTRAVNILLLYVRMTFNPTLVQFKLEALEDVAIESTPFNPTLVQFKPARRGKIGELTLAFQSYLSPIQTWLPLCLSCLSRTFNPTLVQFKPIRFKDITRGEYFFQSYLSPIQTVRPDSPIS